jgi:hypothetical protein
MFVQAINGGGIGGKSGERQVVDAIYMSDSRLDEMWEWGR